MSGYLQGRDYEGSIVRINEVIEGALILEKRGNLSFSITFRSAYYEGNASVSIIDSCLIFNNRVISEQMYIELTETDKMELNALLANPNLEWHVHCKMKSLLEFVLIWFYKERN